MSLLFSSMSSNGAFLAPSGGNGARWKALGLGVPVLWVKLLWLHNFRNMMNSSDRALLLTHPEG